MSEKKIHLGWREWVALPELGIPAIKAKVDTGAKTCALHAFYIETYQKEGEDWVKFKLHPNQYDSEEVTECHCLLSDHRQVTDSGGHKEMRYVIRTQIQIGEQSIEAEITLTDRESMKFRMLLGRNAMKGRFIVDPEASYLLGEHQK